MRLVSILSTAAEHYRSRGRYSKGQVCTQRRIEGDFIVGAGVARFGLEKPPDQPIDLAA